MDVAWLSSLFALVAGAFITVQVGSNTELKKGLGEPLPALLVNYLVGFSAVLSYTLARHQGTLSFPKAMHTPWWSWVGGAAGAVYGLAAIVLASQIGAARLTALVITGQLVSSVIFDHFGWLSFEVHTAGIGRVGGCALMILGLILIAEY